MVTRLVRQAERLHKQGRRREELMKRKDEHILGLQRALEGANEEVVGLSKRLVEGELRCKRLEQELGSRQAALAEGRARIESLELQVSAVSGGAGGAKRFLEDLIGAKEQYLNEATMAKESAEVERRRQEQLAEQNEKQQALIRSLEEARNLLDGRVQEEGKASETLRWVCLCALRCLGA